MFNERKVNSQNEDGNTLLHLAIEYKHVYIIEFLLRKGADVNIKNNYGLTPFDYASKVNIDVIDFLLKNISINDSENDVIFKAIDNEYVLHCFVNENNVNLRNSNNETLLHLAVKRNLPYIVALLLEYKKLM